MSYELKVMSYEWLIFIGFNILKIKISFSTSPGDVCKSP